VPDLRPLQKEVVEITAVNICTSRLGVLTFKYNIKYMNVVTLFETAAVMELIKKITQLSERWRLCITN
jgi:hypothetical protein